MEIQSVIPLGLIVLVAFNLCQADDCPYGLYWDRDHNACRPCSLCPVEVISKDSQWIIPMGQCEIYKSLCPNWCSVETADQQSDNRRAKAFCPPTTPSPPVPFVNVTITGPTYNETASSYTASCTMYFKDMDIPTIQWTNPTGQPLVSSDMSGKWKVTQEVMTQGVVSTLVVSGFEKEDEGKYVCTAHGEKITNETVLLEYVVPPTTKKPDTSPPGTSPSFENSSPKSGETFKPNSSISTIAVVGAVGAVLFFLVLGLALFYLKRRGYIRCSPSTSYDIERLPLNNVKSKLSLENSDFQSAVINGIQTCLDHCDTVIIIHNKKKMKVKNIQNKNQNRFFIPNMNWNDKLEVWIKFRDKEKEFIKALKMNCLKTGNTTVTSAVINCPPVNDTFFLRYREKNSTGSFEPVEALQGGSREIINLQPNMSYCIELGTRGRTGDSGAYIWDWKEEFKTQSLKFQPATATQPPAGLRLTIGEIPASLDLRYSVNCLDDSKLEELTTQEIEIKDLIPGMEQVVQLKAKERTGTKFRLLQDTTFRTAGSVKDTGDYEGDVTTEYEEYLPQDTRSKKRGRSKNANREQYKEQCTTGLKEALKNLRLSRASQKFYSTNCLDPTILKSMMECLVGIHPCKPTMPGPLKRLMDVESWITEKAMQDYAAVFTVLKQFIERKDVHTQAGVDFAKMFLDAHNKPCRLCKQAYLLIQWKTNNMNAPPSKS